jgi:hypothetical protein
MDEINIESEDLSDLPEPAAPASSVADGREPSVADGREPSVAEELLVIETTDLEDAEPLPAAEADADDALPGKDGLGRGQVAGWGLMNLALAGAIGGCLAWAAHEPFSNDLSREVGGWLSDVLRMTLLGATFGGLIGAALGSVEGASAGVAGKALKGAGLGLLVGGAGGVLGGICGQLLWVYGRLHGGEWGSPFLRQVLLRAFSWGLIGVFIGLGQGAQGATPRKLLNGIIGGALGGFVGGFLFDPLSVTIHRLMNTVGPHSGWLSRLVAMTVTGLCTGAAVGLVQELRKEAWLLVTAGPLSGKQFILYRPTTTLGSSPQADICLLKDPGLLPQHLVLQQAPTGHVLVATPEARVALNAHATTHHHLHNGDLIGLGNTVLEYRLKAIPPAAAENSHP